MLKKVKKGDQLNIPADTWNAIIDCVMRSLSCQYDSSSGISTSDTKDGVVEVKKADDVPEEYIAPFSVIALGELLITPESDDYEFSWGYSTFAAHKFSADIINRPFAVLRDPLFDCLGYAVVSGITPVKIDVSDQSHQYAVVQEDSYNLKSAASGSCRILGIESGIGVDKWAVVQLGTPSSGNSYDGYFTASNASDQTAQKVKISLGKAQVNQTIFDVPEAVKTVTAASFIYLESVYNEISELPQTPSIEISTTFYTIEENKYKHLIAVIDWEDGKIKKITQQNYGMIVGGILLICEESET